MLTKPRICLYMETNPMTTAGKIERGGRLKPSLERKAFP